MTAPGPDTAKLLSLAVHELRTPLTIVSGYLRMLLRDRGGPVTDEQRKLLEEAERACGKLAGLVSDLSDLANLEAGTAAFNRGEIPPRTILEPLARPGAATRPVTLEIDASVDEVTIMGDASRLGSALAAVLRQVARESIEAEGVLVSARVEPAPGGRRLEVLVGDARTIDRLHGLDRSALGAFNETRSGNGFGAATARRVIEAHDGRLTGPPGVGAVVHLPVEPRGGRP